MGVNPAATCATRGGGAPRSSMRIYLVVVDDTPEAEAALRFAARRAVKTGGGVEIRGADPPTGVHRLRRRAGDDRGRAPAATPRRWFRARRGRLSRNRACAPRSRCARATAPSDHPRDHRRRLLTSPRWCSARRRPARRAQLVAHFAGTDAGALPVPVMIIPGSLTRDAIGPAQLSGGTGLSLSVSGRSR